MTGGLIQLISIGQQDKYITGNPQISFFKSVYKKYTHFEKTPYIIKTNNPINNNITSTLIYDIPHKGDLLQEIYIKIKIKINHKST